MTDKPSHLRPVPLGAISGALAHAEPPEGWNGITPPSSRRGTSRFLSDVIIELGFAARETVHAAIDSARQHGTTPESLLVDQGAITQDQLSRAIAARHGLDHLDLSVFKVDMAAANLMTSANAKRYDAVPVSFVNERTVLVAMADPGNVLVIDDVALMTGYEVRAAVASREDIGALITRLTRLDDVVASTSMEDDGPSEGPAEIVDLRESADDAPVIKLVNQIIAQAVEQGTSDIHFQPDGKEMAVRFRIDGVLNTSTTVPRRMVAGVVSRIKIMSDLDIAERRIPQDGRVGLRSTATTSTCASSRCRASTARAWSCASWTRTA